MEEPPLESRVRSCEHKYVIKRKNDVSGFCFGCMKKIVPVDLDTKYNKYGNIIYVLKMEYGLRWCNREKEQEVL